MSYSSFEYGAKIDSQLLFNAFFYNPVFKNCSSIFKTLKTQGYYNYRLNGMGGFDDYPINWDLLHRFHAVDKFIKFEDLDYEGETIGLANTPPDQYTLNKAFDLIDKAKAPYSLAFLTHNSHYRFDSPIELAEDWRALKDASKEQMKLTDTSKRQDTNDNYLKSIRYQLKNVFDIIRNRVDEHSIVVLYGDHQPPFVADKMGSKNTPIHILSKNASFIEAFEAYGFNAGLIPEGQQPIRHEACYSLLMKVLCQVFGESESRLPEYKAMGMNFKNE